jgi:hypothetical protein
MILFEHDIWRACSLRTTPRANGAPPWEENYIPYTDLYATSFHPYQDWERKKTIEGEFTRRNVSLGPSWAWMPNEAMTVAILDDFYGETLDYSTPLVV